MNSIFLRLYNGRMSLTVQTRYDLSSLSFRPVRSNRGICNASSMQMYSCKLRMKSPAFRLFYEKRMAEKKIITTLVFVVNDKKKNPPKSIKRTNALLPRVVHVRESLVGSRSSVRRQRSASKYELQGKKSSIILPRVIKNRAF